MATNTGPFDDQFDHLVDVVNNNVHGFRQLEGEFIHPIDFRFLPRYPHQFTLSELRIIPRYLFDTILSSRMPVSVLTWDHYSFWAWTAALTTALHPESMAASLIFDRPSSKVEGPLSNYLPVVSRYFTMNHLVLFPVRHSQLDNRVQAFISNMNPNVDGVEDSTVLGFAGTNGFSILEGFLRRHCEKLNTQEEIMDKQNIEESWRDDGTLPNEPNIRGKLWLWRETNDIPSEIKATLDQIDDISREEYDIDHLNRRIEGFDKSDWNDLPANSKRRESFFWILNQQRNQTVHGERSTQIIGPLVMNLCSLIILDLLDEDLYEEVQNKLMEPLLDPDWYMLGRMTSKATSTPSMMDNILPGQLGDKSSRDKLSPDVFYPIFADERESLRKNK